MITLSANMQEHELSFLLYDEEEFVWGLINDFGEETKQKPCGVALLVTDPHLAESNPSLLIFPRKANIE